MTKVTMGHNRRRILFARLLIGLAQGIGLWWLYSARAEPWAKLGGAWISLDLILHYSPLIVLAALGRIRWFVLASWTAAATMILALLGYYAVWREPPSVFPVPFSLGPGLPIFVFGGAALYILHHLIEPADQARALRAPYAAYVNSAWRDAFQLGLALLFVGVVQGVVYLGAALFAAIPAQSIASALRSDAFVLPLLGLAFAGAVHQTDVKPSLLAGVRTIGLTLLSWLLLLATPLITIFLMARLANGAQPTAPLVLGSRLLFIAAATLIVLVNAAYQDGHARESLPAVLRWCGRGAALLLLPLVVLVVVGLAQRIGEYGLSPQRVDGVAVAGITTVYAAGYFWAAVSPGNWLKRIEAVNPFAALVTVAIILLALSPVADPARLSVDDQVARLQSGATPIERFDFAALNQRFARYGREALADLARSANQTIAAAAQRAMDRSMPGQPSGPRLANAQVLPAGSALPDSFRQQAWTADLPDLRNNAAACMISDAACTLVVVERDAAGPTLIVALSAQLIQPAVLFARRPDGGWMRAGVAYGTQSEAFRRGVAEGQVAVIPPSLPDLRVGETRLHFFPDAAFIGLREAPEQLVTVPRQ